MPRSRRRLRGRMGGLGVDQEMELQIGPGQTSAFVSDEARREAYFANREEILADEPAGMRPWSWWQFESGLEWSLEEPWPQGDAAVAWLRKEGLLTPWEAQELEERRRLFENTTASEMSAESAARYLASPDVPPQRTSNA